MDPNYDSLFYQYYNSRFGATEDAALADAYAAFSSSVPGGFLNAEDFATSFDAFYGVAGAAAGPNQLGFAGPNTYAQEAFHNAALAAGGVATSTPLDTLRAGVFPPQGGGMSIDGDYNYAPSRPLTKKYPAVAVPKPWKMKHQAGRGGHIAYIDRTEAAYFTRKSSCAAFVEAWNMMISHLGSAQDFDQLRISSLLAAVVQAGSGENGLANGFKPPMNGQ